MQRMQAPFRSFNHLDYDILHIRFSVDLPAMLGQEPPCLDKKSCGVATSRVPGRSHGAVGRSGAAAVKLPKTVVVNQPDHSLYFTTTLSRARSTWS